MGNFSNNVSVTFVVEQYLQSFSHVCTICIHVPCHKGQVFNDRFNLRASKFPGGTCPQTSLRSNCALVCIMSTVHMVWNLAFSGLATNPLPFLLHYTACTSTVGMHALFVNIAMFWLLSMSSNVFSKLLLLYCSVTTSHLHCTQVHPQSPHPKGEWGVRDENVHHWAISWYCCTECSGQLTSLSRQ